MPFLLFGQALSEIQRTLKPGGRLLITAPFAFPQCDDVDYWRFSRSFYETQFKDYEIQVLTNLGGLISTLADVLQRPKGKYTGRHRVYKLLGTLIAGTLGHFDTLDGFPLGYGLYAIKR